jgi:hypothetical protein
MPSEILGRPSIHCECQLNNKFPKSLEIHDLRIIFDLIEFIVHLSCQDLNFLGSDVAVESMFDEQAEDGAGVDEVVSLRMLIE